MNEKEKIENLKSLLNREIKYGMTKIKKIMHFMHSHIKLSKKSINSIMNLQKSLNNVKESLDVNMINRSLRLINCNFCHSSMVTNFLQTSNFFLINL